MERIRKAVISDAQEKAKAVIQEARDETQKQIRDLKARLDSEKQAALASAKAACEEEIRRRLGRLTAELRIELLRAKSEIIEEVLQKAMDSLMNLPDEDYLKLIERWLGNMGDTGGEVVVNARDLERFKNGFLDKLNASRPADKKFTLCPEPGDMKGGFILRREGFEIDMRLESQLETLREEAVPEIAEVLFGPESAAPGGPESAGPGVEDDRK